MRKVYKMNESQKLMLQCVAVRIAVQAGKDIKFRSLSTIFTPCGKKNYLLIGFAGYFTKKMHVYLMTELDKALPEYFVESEGNVLGQYKLTELL